MKRLYDMVYRLASRDAVHATLDSLQRHVLPDETKIQVGGFKYQPEKSDLSSTLFAANATMAFLLGIMVDWFPLSQYHDELRDCIARWKQTKSADYEWEE